MDKATSESCMANAETSNRSVAVVGDTVRYRVPKHQRSNGAEWAPAIVTRAWGENYFNVKVLPDCAAPFDATSVSCGFGDPDFGHWFVRK